MTVTNSTFYTLRDAILSGQADFSPVRVFEYIISLLVSEVRECGSVMAAMIMIGALSGASGILYSGEKESGAAHSAFFACFALMAAAAARCFLTAADYAGDVIRDMSDFVTVLSPMLTALLLSGGQAASAAAFHPVMSAAVYVITVLTEVCLLPLVRLSAVLAIVNRITGKVRLSGFTSLAQSVTKWVLTAALTIFTGITAVYGFTAPVLDSITSKTVKFAVGSLVPVVGGLLSDAVETVANSTQLMKNAVGAAGAASICVMCSVPAAKLAAIALMLRLTHAAVEPVTDERLSGLVKDIASSVTMLLGMVITAAVMFVISLGIIMASTRVM